MKDNPPASYRELEITKQKLDRWERKCRSNYWKRSKKTRKMEMCKSREEELKQCIGVLVTNLRGDGLESLKPMSAQMCADLANYGEAVYFGSTCDEAEAAVKSERH